MGYAVISTLPALRLPVALAEGGLVNDEDPLLAHELLQHALGKAMPQYQCPVIIRQFLNLVNAAVLHAVVPAEDLADVLGVARYEVVLEHLLLDVFGGDQRLPPLHHRVYGVEDHILLARLVHLDGKELVQEVLILLGFRHQPGDQRL